MSKIVTINTICTATVEETWTFEVPDDLDVSGQPLDAVLDFLQWGDTEGSFAEDGPGYEPPPGVNFVSVTNDKVYDERDRDALDVTVTSKED